MAKFLPSPTTFLVEEVPAYLPAGEGEHAYLWIEKQNLTTLDAVRRLARVLRVNDRDVGYAGMKDRHATTRQWLSVLGIDPAAAQAAVLDGVRVLSTTRHKNKLRIGHLQGNRFEIVLCDVAQGEASRIDSDLRRFAAEGIANRFGHQRFGAAGDNLSVGLAVLRGSRREPDARRRKLLLSAVQSAVFNCVLDLRARDGLLVVREGDVLEKVGSGGQFVCSDPAADQVRVDAGEIVPTAPMPGGRVREPAPDTAARLLEDKALEIVGVSPEELAGMGRALPGARRPVVVKVTLGDPPAVEEPAGLRLRFSLPAGSYATVVLDALGVEQTRNGQPMLASTPDPD